MITLYTSGPMFGLPHPSPFVIKGDVLLKMSGLEYREMPMTFSGAPKGKVPYISDDGLVLGDSFSYGGIWKPSTRSIIRAVTTREG